MDKRIKTINISKQTILINNKYLIYLDKSNATVYNTVTGKDTPLYIFKWMLDNHLIKR